MIKFNIGDKVERTKSEWTGMQAGDIGTIIDIKSSHLCFKEYSGGHSPEKFKLVEANVQSNRLEGIIKQIVSELKGNR